MNCIGLKILIGSTKINMTLRHQTHTWLEVEMKSKKCLLKYFISHLHSHCAPIQQYVQTNQCLFGFFFWFFIISQSPNVFFCKTKCAVCLPRLELSNFSQSSTHQSGLSFFCLSLRNPVGAHLQPLFKFKSISSQHLSPLPILYQQESLQMLCHLNFKGDSWLFFFFFFSPFHHNTLSPCWWTWKLAWYVSFKMESTQVKVFVADAQGCIKHTFSSPLRWTGKLHRNEWHTKCMNLMCCVQIWCKQQSNWKKKRKNTRIQIQRASAPTHVHRADYLSNGRETVLQWSLWVVESSVLCFEGFCLSMLLLCSVIRVGFALSTSLGQGHCICIIILPLSGFLNTLCGLLHGANTAMSTRLVCWFASEQVL